MFPVPFPSNSFVFPISTSSWTQDDNQTESRDSRLRSAVLSGKVSTFHVIVCHLIFFGRIHIFFFAPLPPCFRFLPLLILFFSSLLLSLSSLLLPLSSLLSLLYPLILSYPFPNSVSLSFSFPVSLSSHFFRFPTFPRSFVFSTLSLHLLLSLYFILFRTFLTFSDPAPASPTFPSSHPRPSPLTLSKHFCV